jgi:hypothetical protein
MKIKIIKEVYSEKQRRYMCAMSKQGADRPEGLSKAEAEEMCDGPMKEISAVGGGSVQGHAGETKRRKKEIIEMFSSSGMKGGLKISIVSAEKERSGHLERSKHQGLKNVMQEDDDSTQPMQGGADNYAMANQGTVWKLSDFADNSRNASRVFDVLRDVEQNIGIEKMKNAVLDDRTSQKRIQVMSNKFGYDSELYMKIAMGDDEAIKKYYQFIINEFLFWSSFNPMASAQQYTGRATLLSKPTKDLAYAQVFRYVKNPSVNNPKSLGQRVAKQAEDYFLDKDLDPALYDLPEE